MRFCTVVQYTSETMSILYCTTVQIRANVQLYSLANAYATDCRFILHNYICTFYNTAQLRSVGFVNKNIHSCLSKLRGKFREIERSSIRSSNVHIYRTFDKTLVRFKLLCSLFIRALCQLQKAKMNMIFSLNDF